MTSQKPVSSRSGSGSRIDTGRQEQEPQDICRWTSLVTVCNLNGVRSLLR